MHQTDYTCFVATNRSFMPDQPIWRYKLKLEFSTFTQKTKGYLAGLFSVRLYKTILDAARLVQRYIMGEFVNIVIFSYV